MTGDRRIPLSSDHARLPEGHQQSAAEQLAPNGEPAALVVGETKPANAELLAEHAVLLDEVGDDLGLLAVHPAGEGCEQEVEREEAGHREG